MGLPVTGTVDESLLDQLGTGSVTKPAEYSRSRKLVMASLPAGMVAESSRLGPLVVQR